MTTGQTLWAFAVSAVVVIGTADHLIRIAWQRHKTREVNTASVVDLTRFRARKTHPSSLPSNVRLLRVPQERGR